MTEKEYIKFVVFNKRKHWYKQEIYECPVCFKQTIYKTRIYGKKPEYYDQIYTCLRYYCGCIF